MPCFHRGGETLQYWDLAEVLVDLIPDWQPWKLRSLFIHRLDGQPLALRPRCASAWLPGLPAMGEAGGPVLHLSVLQNPPDHTVAPLWPSIF